MTLALDVPFLAIFLAIMFYYSVLLSLVTLGILGLIVGLSLAGLEASAAPGSTAKARPP